MFSLHTPEPLATVASAHTDDVRHIIAAKSVSSGALTSPVISICVEGMAKLWDAKNVGSDAISHWTGVGYGE